MSQSTPAATGTPETLFPVQTITTMVETFYGRVQRDALLGPVFDKRIHDWSEHMGRMVRFWRAVLRSDGSFSFSPRGAPPVLHRQIEELSHAHFTHWLSLFSGVVDEVYTPEAAVEVKAAARRIASALSKHLPPVTLAEPVNTTPRD